MRNVAIYWNIFYIFVVIKQIVMVGEIEQYSMFPTESDFSSDLFKESVMTDQFEECLRMGVVDGLRKTKEKFSEGENSMSVIMHCLHEDVYNGIKIALKTQMPNEHFTFTTNVSGNERLFFEYCGYVFIIRLADSTNNNTKQEAKIKNQELSKHVITIVYSLDALRENLNSLSLQYIKGQSVTWHYSIPTKSIGKILTIEDSAVSIEARKPKLKTANYNREAK